MGQIQPHSDKIAFNLISCMGPPGLDDRTRGIDCLILPRQVDQTLPPQEDLSGLLGLAAKGKYWL